jgi:hypothetical protein
MRDDEAANRPPAEDQPREVTVRLHVTEIDAHAITYANHFYAEMDKGSGIVYVALAQYGVPKDEPDAEGIVHLHARVVGRVAIPTAKFKLFVDALIELYEDWFEEPLPRPKGD